MVNGSASILAQHLERLDEHAVSLRKEIDRLQHDLDATHKEHAEIFAARIECREAIAKLQP